MKKMLQSSALVLVSVIGLASCNSQSSEATTVETAVTETQVAAPTSKVWNINNSDGFVTTTFKANPSYTLGTATDYDYLLVNSATAADYRPEIIEAFKTGKQVIFDTNATNEAKTQMQAVVKELVGSSIDSDGVLVTYDTEAQQFLLTPLVSLDTVKVQLQSGKTPNLDNTADVVFGTN